VTITPVNLGNIEKAASLIDRVFRNSPQFVDDTLCAVLRRRVLVKVETGNPVRSFKGRGADFLVRSLDSKQKIVCASAGNFGQAMAYAGRNRGIAVQVFVSTEVNPAKAARIESFGAKVTLAGADFEAAKDHARGHAAQHPECVFVEDGEDDAITEGAGTIGVELLESGAIDTVVLPVGDGALITGVASWIKEHSPGTKIVGVCASGAPAMLESWRNGRVMATQSTETIADGIAVRVPIAKAVDRIRNLVDEMVLVDDASLIEGMQLAASALGLLLEPAGAAGLAAIRAHELPGDRLATVLTGSNLHPKLLPDVLKS
jgi:threonine dehydratase